MEIVHRGGPLVLDDTVGNPRSIEQVARTVRALPRRALRIAYVVRGRRGTTINEHNAEALADLVLDTGALLVVSTSEDAADERNEVSPEERDAALAVLRRRGVPVHVEPRLADAVRHVLGGAHEEDVVLLLGAQGMDAGDELARAVLAERGAGVKA